MKYEQYMYGILSTNIKWCSLKSLSFYCRLDVVSMYTVEYKLNRATCCLRTEFEEENTIRDISL